jgi:DHA1 family bicyclomycin/chloramphenicol resistance-like MFS transporter
MILRERTFLTHAIMGGCSTFCMFAYLSGCSPVFEIGFGLSPSGFALIFGLCAVSLVIGSQLNARLLPRFGLSTMLTQVARVSFSATAVLMVVAFSGLHVLWAVVLPLVVTLGCQGFNNANATAGALSRHALHAGSASALMGTFQFGLGASSGVLVSLFTDGTPRGMAAMMFCGMLCALIADRFRVHVLSTRP